MCFRAILEFVQRFFLILSLCSHPRRVFEWMTLKGSQTLPSTSTSPANQCVLLFAICPFVGLLGIGSSPQFRSTSTLLYFASASLILALRKTEAAHCLNLIQFWRDWGLNPEPQVAETNSSLCVLSPACVLPYVRSDHVIERRIHGLKDSCL